MGLLPSRNCEAAQHTPTSKVSKEVHTEVVEPGNYCARLALSSFVSESNRPNYAKREVIMALQDVLVDELRDLYSAENQLIKALPKMAKGSNSSELKSLFTTHLEETKGQVERLKQIFQHLGEKPTGEHCKGMEGVIAEGAEALDKDEEGAVLDSCIIGAALRTEHYEIAGYTAAIAMANSLGHTDIEELLTQTLNEEQAAAEKVQAAAQPILKEAVESPEEEDDEEGEEDDEEQDDEDEDELEEEDEDDEEKAKPAKKAVKKPAAKKAAK
jgi:ferritin-like metal-binding protein YciE